MQTHASLALKPNSTAAPARSGTRAPARRAGSDAPVLQAKLRIGPVDDPLERAADRVADAVMAGRFASPGGDGSPGVRRKCAACQAEEKWTLRRKCAACEAEEDRTLHRKCAECEAEEETLRREADLPEDEEEQVRLKRDGHASPSAGAEAAAAAVARGGAPLPRVLRSYFEPRLGQGLGGVLIHTDAGAGAAAMAINARAYTLGRDIAFAPGAYAPDTRAGHYLIAHELAHVVQQGGGELVQRRGEEEDPELSLPGGAQLGGMPPDVVLDPTSGPEPGCPRPPTHIGNIVPTPPCNEDGEDVDGIPPLLFCRDSDVFSNPADRDWLRAFVASRPSGTRFRVRAYASAEGPGSAANRALYNRNLSCHRLNRVIRELLNAGVQEDQIEAVALGQTDKFGRGAAGQAANRRVVVQAVPPGARLRPSATDMLMTQIRDTAKQRIVSGDYDLGADAYTARWSCGRFRTLAEAVNRTTVLVEGIDTSLGASPALGTTSSIGAYTIVISPRIEHATDPIGCAANRIVDLTFHHFARPVIPTFHDQHRGGRHLVFLAGLPECRIALDPANTRFQVASPPDPADPFARLLPRCADLPLPGPMTPQLGPSTMETPPTFTAQPITVTGAVGRMRTGLSPGPRLVAVEQDPPFELEAVVHAAGDPALIASYEIGFLQTIQAETFVNTHADGRRERRRLPLPLRDGPPRDHPHHDPPWFAKISKVRAAPGDNRVRLRDAPGFSAFTFLPDIPASQFFRRGKQAAPGGGAGASVEFPTFIPGLDRPPLKKDAGKEEVLAENRMRKALLFNAPDHGRRVILFNTWVVARRADPVAPPTLGATDFLAGLQMTHRTMVSWRSTPSGYVSGGEGSFDLTTRPATPDEAQSMMLRGATAGDFFVGPTGVPLFAEFLQIDPPLPRAQQLDGLPRDAYLDAVRRAAQPRRTTRAVRREIVVVIRVQVATGRVDLDTPELARSAIRILDASSKPLDTAEARAFARDIFPEVRKLVAAPGFADPQQGGATASIAVRLQAMGSTP